MMRSRWAAAGCCFLAALIMSPAWSSAPTGSIPPQPGTINYIEGQASIGTQALTDQSVGSAALAAGQLLVTKQGRVEVLLTPGIFLRLGDNSSLRMLNAGLADTVLGLDKGRAMVEVTEIRPQNNVRIEENGASARLLKPGLYDFDADRSQVRVFDGQAKVDVNDQQVELKGGHELVLAGNAKLKGKKFDKKAPEDDFYRWSSLRSSYLAEANADVARRYAGSYGWAPDLWTGAGWYWDPWFSAYTFVPADGFFYSPFGWGFYSPFYVYGAPYFGYGHYYHHFTPWYRPPVAPVARSFAGSGFGRGTVGGFRAAPGGGFHGGGFHGGGFAGGGFHGGFGGGGRR